MNFSYTIAIIIILLVLIPWLWRYRLRPHLASNELHKQFKHHKKWKQIKKTEQLLVTLYQRVNGAAVSASERKRLHIEEDAFIYGEIQFLSFFGVLEKVNPQTGEVFYDLGSGTGKAVLTAAMYYDFSKACGIEFLPGLHDLANMQLRKAQMLENSQDKDFSRRLSSVQFIQDNFLHCDFSDGDIIFVNATCLSYPTWHAIIEKLKALKSGSRVIVLSKKIPLEEFTLIHQSLELMSWGMNSVNIYIKRH